MRALLLVFNDDIRCLLVVRVIYNYWGIPSGHGVVLTLTPYILKAKFKATYNIMFFCGWSLQVSVLDVSTIYW